MILIGNREYLKISVLTFVSEYRKSYSNLSPEHAADVKREYLFESPRQRGRWLRTKVKERFPNEEKYRKFDLVLGLVHRRIAKNRVEVKFYLIFKKKTYFVDSCKRCRIQSHHPWLYARICFNRG